MTERRVGGLTVPGTVGKCPVGLLTTITVQYMYGIKQIFQLMLCIEEYLLYRKA